MSLPRVVSLYHYPVKGLSPHALDRVEVGPGETFPFDRAYAIENGPIGFDEETPRFFPKTHFLMLARNERLAALDCRFDTETHVLTISRDGKQVARGALNTGIGRKLIEQFFAAWCRDELRGAPRILHASAHSFSDKEAKCVHIVNLATVRDLARRLGAELDPLRFRANIYVDGVEPWIERDWLGASIGVGRAEIKISSVTNRCEATSVDPKTGVRDQSIPAMLLRDRGHSDLGVYGIIVCGGVIASGDSIRPPRRETD